MKTTIGCHPSLFLYFIAAMHLSTETSATCPSFCDCSKYSTSKEIRCGHRHLTAVPVGLPNDTRILRLEFNKLTELAAGDFSSLSQLESLYLYNNHIGEIEEGAFRGLSSLRRLHLESNDISSITNLTFQEAPSLEKLLIGNNRIRSLPTRVFRNLLKLVQLDLAKNSIEEFPADVSKDLAAVETLDLSYNPTRLMLSPDFRHMVALQTLKLNHLSGADDASSPVHIPESAFDGLVNLRQLELDGNFLTSIPFAVRSLANLTSISLFSNSIQTITTADFHQPSFLQYLRLDDNALVAVPAAALAQLPNLTDLYLDYNPISAIPARAFSQNFRLETVSLAHTNLTLIDKGAFLGLDHLQFLWLAGNNLITIADGVMDDVNPAVELQLSGNPLHCDCHLRGFGAWLKNNHTGTFRGNLPQCVTPERLRDAVVRDVDPEQFACKPYEIKRETLVSVTSGMDVLLPCAIEADPRQDSFWIISNHAAVFPDQPQPPFTVMPALNSSLLLSDVSDAHGGLYTCVVGNAAGEARSSITLDVRQRPVVTAVPTPGAANADVGLIFGVAGGSILLIMVVVFVIGAVINARNRPPIPAQEEVVQDNAQAEPEGIEMAQLEAARDEGRRRDLVPVQGQGPEPEREGQIVVHVPNQGGQGAEREPEAKVCREFRGPQRQENPYN